MVAAVARGRGRARRGRRAGQQRRLRRVRAGRGGADRRRPAPVRDQRVRAAAAHPAGAARHAGGRPRPDRQRVVDGRPDDAAGRRVTTRASTPWRRSATPCGSRPAGSASPSRWSRPARCAPRSPRTPRPGTEGDGPYADFMRGVADAQRGGLRRPRPGARWSPRPSPTLIVGRWSRPAEGALPGGSGRPQWSAPGVLPTAVWDASCAGSTRLPDGRAARPAAWTRLRLESRVCPSVARPARPGARRVGPAPRVSPLNAALLPSGSTSAAPRSPPVSSRTRARSSTGTPATRRTAARARRWSRTRSSTPCWSWPAARDPRRRHRRGRLHRRRPGHGAVRAAPLVAERAAARCDQSRQRLPVVVENDANAALWAEWRFGAGRGESHLVCVTLAPASVARCRQR